jgi:hypothetical protein
MNRIKAAWEALNGRYAGNIRSPEKIYVYREAEYSNRFVQLLNFQDHILALDAEGKIWDVGYDNHGYFFVQLRARSPLGRF